MLKRSYEDHWAAFIREIRGGPLADQARQNAVTIARRRGAICCAVIVAGAVLNGINHTIGEACLIIGVIALAPVLILYVIDKAKARGIEDKAIDAAYVPRYRNGKAKKRWHFFVPSGVFGILAIWSIATGQVGYAAFLAVVAMIVFAVGNDKSFYKTYNSSRFDDMERARLDEEKARRKAATLRQPPIWPPRKPEDWGWEIQEQYRAEAQRVRIANTGAPQGFARAEPMMPVIPSWEEHYRNEQAHYPRQIRWARDAAGDWHKIEYGNPAKRPTNGLLPVYQSMQNESTGEWTWVKIGEGPISLDWQNGPATFRKVSGTVNGKPVTFLKPVGTAGVTPTPLPIEPGGEHGDSREQSVDDLVKAGIVAPR